MSAKLAETSAMEARGYSKSRAKPVIYFETGEREAKLESSLKPRRRLE
jgi:hypothetical protein